LKGISALLVFVVLSLGARAQAGFEPETYSFSPTLGIYAFDRHQQLKNSALAGLRISRHLTSRWTTEAVILYVPTESKLKTGSDNGVNGFLYNLDGLYHLSTQGKFLPFLAAGGGGQSFNGNDTGADHNLMLNYGLGAKYFFSDAMALRADVRQVWVDDGHTEHNMVYTLGFEFAWGRGKNDVRAASDPTSAGAPADADSDKDGVPDSRDLCPNTPHGVSVDQHGCPLDSDGDGVPDHLDKCPNTPAGLITDRFGCTLDTDADGVPDSRDHCADTPRGLAVDEKGCPIEVDNDSDGDGVLDSNDRCPGTPAGTPVDEHGCPLVIKEKTTTQSHIRFDTGLSIIKEEFMGEVERIANYLKKFPEAVIEIEGHTDTTGPEKLNKRLSLERAESLRNALVDRFGIQGQRLITRGFSWNRPIADNATAEGRQKNRRVVVTLDPRGE